MQWSKQIKVQLDQQQHENMLQFLIFLCCSCSSAGACVCVLCNINKNCLLQLLAICFATLPNREQKPFRHIVYISPRRQLHFHFHGTLLRSNVDFRCRYSLTTQTPPLGGSAQTADAGHALSLSLFPPLEVNNKRRLELLSAFSCFNMRNSTLSCLSAPLRPATPHSVAQLPHTDFEALPVFVTLLWRQLAAA